MQFCFFSDYVTYEGKDDNSDIRKNSPFDLATPLLRIYPTDKTIVQLLTTSLSIINTENSKNYHQ